MPPFGPHARAGPHCNLWLNYSAIGPSEGYVSPMVPYPSGPHGQEIDNYTEGGGNIEV